MVNILHDARDAIGTYSTEGQEQLKCGESELELRIHPSATLKLHITTAFPMAITTQHDASMCHKVLHTHGEHAASGIAGGI